MMPVRTEIGKFACALGFFSRLPIPDALFGQETAKLDKAAPWFPVAGLVIALFPSVIYWFASALLPYPVAAGLALAVLLVVTGALHEDGLADCADALGGGSDREARLRIMRDSANGTYGTLALIMSVGLRWFAIAALPPLTAITALLVAHSASRGGISTALAFSSYARESGTGSAVSDGIAISNWVIVMVLTLLIALLFAGLPGMVAATSGIALAGLFLWWFHAQIGGYTGDALGAMQQIAEIAILVIFVAFSGALR